MGSCRVQNKNLSPDQQPKNYTFPRNVDQLGVLCYKQKNVKEKASTVQPEKSNRCQLFYEGEKQQCVNSQRGNVMEKL